MSSSTDLSWHLLYTKPRTEAWVEANLRRQGYATLFPRVRARSGFDPLFPRYVFAGFEAAQSPRPMRSTRGVLYVVQFGDAPARVPESVVAEIRERMDGAGVVTVEPGPRERDSLFARQERARARALARLVEAGFRVKVA